MSRTAILFAFAAAMLAVRSSFALDSGMGVGGKGGTAVVSRGTNTSINYEAAQTNIASSTYVGGRNATTQIGGKNTATTDNTNAIGSGIPISGSKGGSTDKVVAGRLSEPPMLHGKRARDTVGGIGM